MSLVYLFKTDNQKYPEKNFNPDTIYPEYIFSDKEINSEKNPAYEGVRSCLYGLGLDKDNYGTNKWNPLGDLVKPGQTIVIKPNLVMDINENKSVQENAMECLITHPSCIRAITDYCIKALLNEHDEIYGRIVIADAPMQGCDFDNLKRKMHLNELISFYQREGFDIELIDLRQYQSHFNPTTKVIDKKVFTTAKGVTVHLGDKSMHSKAPGNEKYQVSDYERNETMLHHHGNVHDYEVSETILEADLLINFSKPKTHRLAGITAALKNMVGATYNKATLPHRKAGAIKEGGDAYQHKNWFKKMADMALTLKIRAENKKQYFIALFYRLCYGAFLIIGRKFGKDNYYIGSWFGNDTIWRTVVDLNYIVSFADKRGKLQDVSQRNILYLGDMIIAGEGNGPVKPEPKKLGIILGSMNGASFDKTVCKVMGFPEEKIPMIVSLNKNETFMNTEACQIKSNSKVYEGDLEKIIFPKEWKFKPHEGWQKVLGGI